MKVLHITPHLGGGVGTVVLNYLEFVSSDEGGIESEVLLLDDINAPAKAVLENSSIPYADKVAAKLDLVWLKIDKADIVLIHWWNHPLLYDLLVNSTFPPCRLVIWTHISGQPAPNCFVPSLFHYPDRLVFTTPLSRYDPEFMRLSADERQRVSVIWSTGGVERLERYIQARDTFQVNEIGYVGNLDYTKLYPSFVSLCDSIDIDDAKYVVIGPENKNLTEDVSESAFGGRYELTGYISEHEKFLRMAKFACFGYPLARHHYATCDQSIQESMALGIPPVVFANPMESYMVQHGSTGLVARDEPEYRQFVRAVCTDHTLRERLSGAARKYASLNYSIAHMANQWHDLFETIITLPKTPKIWGKRRNRRFSGAQLFVESLGHYGGVFEAYCAANSASERAIIESQIKSLAGRPEWVSATKSTAHHYLKFFPEDSLLQLWSSVTRPSTLEVR